MERYLRDEPSLIKVRSQDPWDIFHSSEGLSQLLNPRSDDSEEEERSSESDSQPVRDSSTGIPGVL
ncbi:Krueppellike factor 7like, partial [Caligus rogercresseyi]